MNARTGQHAQDRIASFVAPSMAMMTAGAWVACSAPVMGGMSAMWAPIYQAAYDAAVRQVRATFPGREFPPSMN